MARFQRANRVIYGSRSCAAEAACHRCGLSSARVNRRQDVPPTAITLTAYELDETMHRGLDQTLSDVADVCSRAGVAFTSELRGEDFLAAGVAALDGDLFGSDVGPYDAVILNPPYRKIGTDSQERELARRIGLETSNIYTAFVAVAAGLLQVWSASMRSVCRTASASPSSVTHSSIRS